MQPTVSICVCTRNRPEELRRCLTSILGSAYPVAQTVVSDDSTDGRTRSMVRAHFARMEYLEGPRRGLGANRNHALSAATGDFVLFMDDDACLGEQFIERSLRAVHPNERRVIISGCVAEHGQLIRAHDQTFLGYQRVVYRPGQPLKTIVMSSSLFPRSLFAQVRFDDKLRYGYDEVDIASQALAHGYAIVPCDDAVNSHYPSAVHRDEYMSYKDASRLYVTFKRYAVCERSYLKAALYAVVAPVHCALAGIRRRRLAGLLEALRAISNAGRYAMSMALSGQIWRRV
jgi:GT2 family glycosyltransferase